jgi:hypothetical protein
MLNELAKAAAMAAAAALLKALVSGVVKTGS